MRLCLLGLWLGMVYGLVEAAEFMALSLVPGALAWRNGNASQVVWVAPLVYGALFALAGLTAGLAARLTPRVNWEQVTIFVLVFAGAYFAGTLQGQLLSNLSALILSTGVALTALRLFRRSSEAWLGWMTKTVPQVLLLVALLFVADLAVRAGRESLTLSRLPQPAPEAPNILVLVMDTQRADRLSLYGYSRTTSPRIDSLAGSGIVYRDASATSSWTLPSHATMMTGRPLHDHRAGIMGRPFLDEAFPTLAEVLTDAGYATGGFVSNVFWCGRQTGLARGFVHYEDYFGSLGDALVRTVAGRRLAYDFLPKFGYDRMPGRKWADRINADFLRWFDERSGRPVFAFLNYFDVHAPLHPPEPYAGRFASQGPARSSGEIDIGALTVDMEVPDTAALRLMSDKYDESIMYLDEQIGNLMAQLAARGELENTVIFLTSDHGESFGEHGMVYHGHSLYRDQLHVPLIVWLPGTTYDGVEVPRPVGVHQIPATVMDLLGIADHPFPGSSLLDVETVSDTVLSEVARRSIVPSFWPTSYGSVASLGTERWHYILKENGEEELYDIVADPGELLDLAPQNPDLTGRFKTMLNGKLLNTGLPWDPPAAPSDE